MPLSASATIVVAPPLRWLAGCSALAVVTLIVFYFHNRFWWPPDDGASAYVAARLLAGDVLNVDIRDIHPGYVHFIHAVALRIFGEDLVSLRYPLAVLTVLQAAIVYLILRPRGALAAAAGAVAAGSLSFVQFLNATANWYVLFLAFAMVGCLTWLKRDSAERYIAIGILLASALLIRQLSGIFLAMGTIVWLLSERGAENASRSWLAKGTLLLIAGGLAGYFALKGSVSAFALFGVWPLAAIVLVWRHLEISNSALIRIYALIALGGLLGAMPLLAYLLYHGSFSAWFDDVVVSALHLNGLPFVAEQSFGLYFSGVIFMALTEPSLLGFFSAFYWLTLLGLPIAVGVLFWKRASGALAPRDWHPATIVALFFAPVSAHYQIPIYLTYTSCLTLVGLMFLAGSERSIHKVAALAFLVSAIGLTLHAGQPLTRGFDGIILGKRVSLEAPAGLPQASVAMELSDAKVYREIITEITRHAAPHEPILALPFIPEFYFLSGRRAAVSFMGVPFGIRDEADLSAVTHRLIRSPPKIVVNRRVDKYHSPLSERLVEWIKGNYSLLRSVGDFDVYVASP